MDLSIKQGHSPRYQQDVSISSTFDPCKACDYYKKQLMEKDKVIFDLQSKMHVIHDVVGGLGLVGHQCQGDMGSRYPVPILPTIPIPLLGSWSSLMGNVCSNDPSTNESSTPTMADSQLKTPPRPTNPESDFSTIKIQEIIDRVVERSPVKGSRKFREIESNECFKNLFRRLEPDLDSAKENKTRESYQEESTYFEIAKVKEESCISESEYETCDSSSSSVSSSQEETISKASARASVASNVRQAEKGDDVSPIPPGCGRDMKRSFSDFGLTTSVNKTNSGDLDVYQSSNNKIRRNSAEAKLLYGRDRASGFQPLKHSGYWKASPDVPRGIKKKLSIAIPPKLPDDTKISFFYKKCA